MDYAWIAFISAFAGILCGRYAQTRLRRRAFTRAMRLGHGWPPVDPATIPPPPPVPPPVWRSGYVPSAASGPRGVPKPPQGGTGVVDSPLARRPVERWQVERDGQS